jgi:hypothetical protein
MTENNLAPWLQPSLVPQGNNLSAYVFFSRLAGDVAPAQIQRTQSVDCPIAAAIIDSLREELWIAEQKIRYLEQALREARGDDD